jgi:hypothetical protein
MADEHIIAASVTLDTSEAGDSVEELKKKLEALRADMNKSVGEVKVDTAKAEASIGEIKADIDSIGGKDVAIELDTNDASTQVKALDADLQSISDKDVAVNVNTTKAAAGVDALEQSIESIEGKDIPVSVDADTTGVEALKDELSQIEGADVAVEVNTEAASQDIDELKQDIDSIGGASVAVAVNTDEANSEVDALKDNLSTIQSDPVNVEVNTDAASIDELKDELAGIEDKSVQIAVEADTQAVDDVKSELDSIQADPIAIDVDTADASRSIDELQGEIGSIDDAAISITADTTQAQDDIAKLGEDVSELPAVQVDTDEAQKNVKDLKEQALQVKSTLIDSSGKIVVDTSEAVGKVGELKEELAEISDVQSDVSIDTTDAVANIQDVKEAIEDIPDAQVDTTQAAASLKGLASEAKSTDAAINQASGEIKVETASAEANVKELQKDVDDVKHSVDGASGTIKVNTTSPSVKGLKKDLDDVTGSLKSTGAAAAKAGGDVAGSTSHFANLKGQLGALPGPLGSAANGVSGLSSAFKALLANPVGLVILAIVGALALLYKAFTATNDGADKMEQIFTGLKAIGEVVLNTILKLAGAIGKLFSGDFSGAFDDAKAAVTGFGDAAVKAFTEAADAARRMQEVEDAMRDLGVSRAKLNRDLAQTKEIISDENASLAEKKKAIETVRQAEGAQTAQELENSRKKLKALQDLHKAGDGDVSDDELQAEADAKAEIFRLEEKSAADVRALNKQERSIEKQELQKLREERQRAAEAQKAERQKLVEYTNKLTQLQQQNELLLIKDGHEKELKQLQNKIEAEKRANDLAFKDKKITKEQQANLDEALDTQLKAQTDVINQKHNEEVAKKEADFQKELASLSNSIKLKGIKDSRERERVELNIQREEKINAAITQYKDDQAKLAEVKALIDEENRLSRAALEDKFQAEDDKKKLEKDIAKQQEIIDAQNADFEAKRAAVDAEQVLFKDALDKKLLTEQEYNAKVKGLTDARIKITQLETDHKKKQLQDVGGALVALADLVGKQTVAGKALGIATALINTYQGASEALKQKSVLPSPLDVAAKVINVATVIATGLKTVKSIASVQVPGGGGGGQTAAGSPITAAAAPVAPVQTSTKLDEGTVANLNNKPVRAYVVAQDSAAAVQREQRLQGQSVLGGG